MSVLVPVRMKAFLMLARYRLTVLGAGAYDPFTTSTLGFEYRPRACDQEELWGAGNRPGKSCRAC